MKRVIYFLILCGVSCRLTKQTTSNTLKLPLLEVTTISYGRDGYDAKLIDQHNNTYNTSISIPNLGNAYIALKVGDKVYIQGDYSNKNPTFIITKRIIKQNN